jgi:DNA-binding GntR family transcriptional regulator
MSECRGGSTDAEYVYQGRGDDIAGRRLKPGMPVRKMSLAEPFGVLHTPVRQTFRRLQQDGILGRACGLEVPSVDPEEVVEVYDLRILLEAEVAGSSSKAHTIVDIVCLESLLARDIARVDPHRALPTSTTLGFHAADCAAAHNPVVEDLLRQLTIQCLLRLGEGVQRS